MRLLLGVLLPGALGCSGSDDRACTTRVAPGSDDDGTVQTALIEAQAGDTVCFDEGTYHFRSELSLTSTGVALLGAGRDSTILDFSSQDAGANGLSISGDDFRISDLWIKNAKGDGLRVQDSSRIMIHDLRVTWDAGSVPENGAYAIYPVTCTDVLIERCEVVGASDAGIYVGQSTRVIVRENDVHGNVAGIEIENTTGAEVTDNHAWDNTGGILAFNLPDLPVQDGRRTLFRGNDVDANNHENFAIAGNIVSFVPAGTGILILATDEIEMHHNEIHDNISTGVLVASYQSLMMPFTDTSYDPYSETIWIHDNTFRANGTSPQGILLLANQATLEDVLWDGYVDAAKDNSDGHLNLCLRENGSATFRMVNVEAGFMDQSTDATPHDCALANLAPIVLMGVPL